MLSKKKKKLFEDIFSKPHFPLFVRKQKMANRLKTSANFYVCVCFF